MAGFFFLFLTYLWLSHIVVWQKPTQHDKAIILQLKILRTVKNTEEVAVEG